MTARRGLVGGKVRRNCSPSWLRSVRPRADFLGLARRLLSSGFSSRAPYGSRSWHRGEVRPDFSEIRTQIAARHGAFRSAFNGKADRWTQLLADAARLAQVSQGRPNLPGKVALRLDGQRI
jgi:hypothetical protein